MDKGMNDVDEREFSTSCR